jgi:hypothetical protein
MNSNGPTTIIAILASLAGAFYVMASILLGGGNELAALCDYLLIGSIFLGLFFPKRSLFVWFFVCAYTDLLKRLLIVSGRVSLADLFSVLGIPPAMLGGIVLSILISAFTGRLTLTLTHWKLFIASCVAVVLAGVAAALDGSGAGIGGVLKGMANTGFYAMLLFVIPSLFQGKDDAVRLLRALLWIFLPVALYGIYQAIFGYQDFEIEYLKTGLSIEIKNLINNEVRPFSTLNSATALSAICAVLSSVSLSLMLISKPEGHGRMLGKVTGVCFTLIYLCGVVASTSRSSLIVVPFVLLAGRCFCTRRSTWLIYAGCGIAFLALVFSAEFLLDRLGNWQGVLDRIAGDSQFAGQMSRIGTFSDRLMGFIALTKNPEVYTLFGYGADRGTDPRDPLFCHDMITGTVVRYGVVTALIFGIIVIRVLTLSHRVIYRLDDPSHRRLGATLLALAFSFFVVSMISGTILQVFPVNVFLFLFLSLLVLVAQTAAKLHGTTNQPLASDGLPPFRPSSAQPFPGAPANPLGRFTPTAHPTTHYHRP